MPADLPWSLFAFQADSSWGTCLQGFLLEKYERSSSQSTIVRYRQVLTRFFSEPPKLPDRYHRHDVEAFLRTGGRGNGRIGQVPSPGTRNNRLSVLNSFYTYAGAYMVSHEDGRIEPLMTHMSPTTGLHHIQVPRAYRSIPFANFERLFAAIPTDTTVGLKYRALFLMLFWTARRISEIVNLRWKDIEETTLIDEDGSSRTGWVYHFRGKRRKMIDDLAELPQPAKDALDAYLRADGRIARMKADDPLFTGYTHSTTPLTDQAAWNAIKRYAVQAGIDPKSITLHSFRHMAAQVRLQSGQGIVSISRLLRHHRVATTWDYAQGLVSSSDDGAKLLTERFGKFSKG